MDVESRAREWSSSPVSRRRAVVLLLRNSPWISIAALLHVLVFAVFSVVYIAREQGERRREGEDLAVRVASSPPAPEARDEEPPELLIRDAVPLLSAREPGVAVPEHLLVPDAAPGLAGEITDETDASKPPGHENPDPEALSTLPSGALGGTPIGVGARGHVGAGTSAFSGRFPGGGGPGGGGRGDGGGNGPTGGWDESTLAALEWLARHQSSDGRWSADRFDEQCDGSSASGACTGLGNPAHDVGLTGLALLCFLGAGETHASPRFGATVRRGLVYLTERQREGEDGCFGPRIGQHWAYDHACATLALAEAYGMTGAKAFREPAQLGVAFILRAQNPYSAWRYAYPPDGDDDSSVTGWMVMALKSAAMAGLAIDRTALDNAVAFVDEVTDESGRTGYTALGETSSRLPSFAASFPPEKSESLTAVGMLVRVFCGRDPRTDPMLDKGAERLARRLPEWSDDGSIDFYYWYYGTLAMHQLGGARWDEWSRAIESSVVKHQRAEPSSCEHGSWDAVDPWSSEGGRVYATALNCLTTEVHYRYPRVFGGRK